MVVAAQVGQGSGNPVNDAVQRANATKSFVYFKLRDKELYAVPSPPKRDCEGKVIQIGSTLFKGVIKGKTNKCIKVPPEKIEKELKYCTFVQAESCLDALYSSWASCTLNFYLGEIYQSGYLATIACDTCMNTKLGGSPSFGGELLNIIDADIIDCRNLCENTQGQVDCITDCEEKAEVGGQACEDEYDLCEKSAGLAFKDCKSQAPQVDPQCVDNCYQTYLTNSSTCLTDETNCINACGADLNCIIACALTRTTCESTAIETYATCKDVCSQATNDAVTDCIGDRDTAMGICGDRRNECLEPIHAEEIICQTKNCDPILDECLVNCEEVRSNSDKAGDKFKNSAGARSGAKHKGKKDTINPKDDPDADTSGPVDGPTKEEYQGELAEEIDWAFS